MRRRPSRYRTRPGDVRRFVGALPDRLAALCENPTQDAYGSIGDGCSRALRHVEYELHTRRSPRAAHRFRLLAQRETIYEALTVLDVLDALAGGEAASELGALVVAATTAAEITAAAGRVVVNGGIEDCDPVAAAVLARRLADDADDDLWRMWDERMAVPALVRSAIDRNPEFGRRWGNAEAVIRVTRSVADAVTR